MLRATSKFWTSLRSNCIKKSIIIPQFNYHPNKFKEMYIALQSWQQKNISTTLQASTFQHIKSEATKDSGEKEGNLEIQNIDIIHGEKVLKVNWREKNQLKTQFFPFVWLRDHCQCSKCFHPISRSRTALFDDLRLDVTPKELKHKETSTDVTWDDGHKSSFSFKWMYDRGFEKHNSTRKRPNAYRLPKIHWDRKHFQNIPVLKYDSVMTDEKSLIKWLQMLEIYGFVFINDAPAERGHVRKLVERVTFIKKTHYGEEFSVKAKPDPSNVAYSSGPLQLHTDLPYYDYKPGLQLIHCVIQFDGEGAESQLTDAQHVAWELKRKHPHLFKVLSETYVDWCDIGVDENREFHKILPRPVICLGPNGDISRINFSHPQRDSYFNVNLSTVFMWYEAMKTFHNMLKDPKYCVEFKMSAGTIQTFDNHRIVHGRTAYEEGKGNREIEGCYMDWDELLSRRRVLESKT